MAAEKRRKAFLPELEEKENEAQNEIEGNFFHQEAKNFYFMQRGFLLLFLVNLFFFFLPISIFSFSG